MKFIERDCWKKLMKMIAGVKEIIIRSQLLFANEKEKKRRKKKKEEAYAYSFFS